jgi:hypothetical protein
MSKSSRHHWEPRIIRMKRSIVRFNTKIYNFIEYSSLRNNQDCYSVHLRIITIKTHRNHLNTIGWTCATSIEGQETYLRV